ncbi:unnamed protein product [Mytilus coruscus]|uniref:DUF659 domain-containing protein n=1 Tax=Mytilus coruscus TaxID=42192 RepID=A0A6J8BSD2_MYTCO|nr:unnamed protein product [Mytilus coruscus]
MSDSLYHFDFLGNIDDRNTKFKAKCKHCFSVISGSLKKTSIVVTHLKEVRQLLHDNLKKAGHICFTVDLWSNRSMKGFLGITAHYVLNWEMKSAMIACKRFKGRHTAENILHEYEECITSFNINDKMFCVISDNASNMVKAFSFSVPGYTEPDDQNCLNKDNLDGDFE